ncbi:ATP-binding protein [Thermodesulfobacteriota bacterium]
MTEEKDLFQQLAAKIKAPNSRYIPELFRMIVDEVDAEILLAMPATLKDLAERFHMDSPEMEEKLKAIFIKGLVFKTDSPDGIVYRFLRDVLQFHDGSNIWVDAPTEFHDLWETYMDEEWADNTEVMAGSMERPFFRVIPVEQTLSARSQILAYESCQDIIDMSDSISVTNCPCRARSRKCERPLEVCVQLGKAADYAVERGTGRAVTKEEAMQILREAEEGGLVHNTLNKAGGMYFICNCCGCCCIALRSIVDYGKIVTDPSRFLAKVDESACTACGTCEETCYFDAIHVEEKDGNDVAVVNAEKCLGCGLCRVSCPDEAISLDEVREKEFIPEKYVAKK